MSFENVDQKIQVKKINFAPKILLEIIFYGLYCEPYTLRKCGHFGTIQPGSRTFLMSAFDHRVLLKTFEDNNQYNL